MTILKLKGKSLPFPLNFYKMNGTMPISTRFSPCRFQFAVAQQDAEHRRRPPPCGLESSTEKSNFTPPRSGPFGADESGPRPPRDPSPPPPQPAASALWSRLRCRLTPAPPAPVCRSHSLAPAPAIVAHGPPSVGRSGTLRIDNGKARLGGPARRAGSAAPLYRPSGITPPNAIARPA